MIEWWNSFIWEARFVELSTRQNNIGGANKYIRQQNSVWFETKLTIFIFLKKTTTLVSLITYNYSRDKAVHWMSDAICRRRNSMLRHKPCKSCSFYQTDRLNWKHLTDPTNWILSETRFEILGTHHRRLLNLNYL